MFLQLNRNTLIKLFMGLLLSFAYPSAVFSAWQQPPFHFPNTGSINQLALASDANGNGIALIGNQASSVAEAWNYTDGVWQQTTFNPQGINPDSVSLAMDDSGTAIAMFHDQISGKFFTRFFNGTIWGFLSPDPLDTSAAVSSPSMSLDMNGPSSGVVLWVNDGNVNTSFLSTWSWGPITTLNNEPNPQGLTVAFSANGTAIAVWQSDTTGGIVASNFFGGTWHPVVPLDPTGVFATSLVPSPGAYRNAGIDDNGNAFVVWVNNSGQVVVQKFSGTTSTWIPSQIIDASSGNSGTSVSVAPGGTAVAVWKDSSSNGQSSSYDGIQWSPKTQFTFAPISTFSTPSISVDNFGNALVVWGTATPQVLSARMPLGGIWGNPELVADVNTSNPEINSTLSSLSSNGIGFAAWMTFAEGDEFSQVFANVTLAPTPPLSISARSCHNRYPTYTDHVHIITWTPSTDPSVVAYYLRRNGILIATAFSTDPITYCDHNRCGKRVDVYTVTAVDINGVESEPLTVSIR